MLLRFFMISELILTLKFFLTDLAVKLTLMLFILPSTIVRDSLMTDLYGNIIYLILFPVVFLDFAKTLLFQTLLHVLHFLLLLLLLLLTLNPFLLLLLFLFSKTANIGNKTRISLPHVR